MRKELIKRAKLYACNVRGYLHFASHIVTELDTAIDWAMKDIEKIIEMLNKLEKEMEVVE